MTIDCFDRAQQLDPSVRLPEAEISELKQLLDHSDPSVFRPSDKGIGFRRQLMRRPLTGGWSVGLPGYFYDDTEDDGTTVVYWYANRTLRGSSFSFDGERASRVDSTELSGTEESLRFSKDHLTGTAAIDYVEGADESYWQLQGQVLAPGTECVVTICFTDRGDEDWAIETWKSVFVPSQDENRPA